MAWDLKAVECSKRRAGGGGALTKVGHRVPRERKE